MQPPPPDSPSWPVTPPAPAAPPTPPTAPPVPAAAPTPVWHTPSAPAPAAVAQAAPPSPATPPSPTAADGEGSSHRGVAILLGLTAATAALVGALATGAGNDAGDAWQSALRTEVKRSAAADIALGQVYQGEVPTAVEAVGLRITEGRLREAASAATGATATVLTEEADTLAGVRQAMGTSNELMNGAYDLPGGGVDLGKRLAAVRAEDPDMVALDPQAQLDEGDALGIKSFLLTLALLPLGFAALFGALAEPFDQHRRALLAVGTVALATGALIALAVGVLA